MADETVNIKVQVEGGEAVKSVGNIRKELKEANAELIAAQRNFGEYSDEAVAAAKKVAQLKDAVQDARETADLFDPGKKFQAFSGALSAVAGGFAAVQGGLGLLGVESEAVEKQLLKVQSALALSQGLSVISDSARQFELLALRLKTIGPIQQANAIANRLAASTMAAFGVSVNTTSVAFQVLKGAIAATGIGLLVVAIGTVVQAFNSFTGAAEKARKAQEDFNKQSVKLADAGLEAELQFIERNQKLLEARAKAEGKSQSEITKIQQQSNDLRLDAQRRHLNSVANANEESAKKSALAVKELENEKQIIQLNAQADERKRNEDAAKKRSEEAKQRLEKEKAEANQLAEARKQATKSAEEQIRTIREELILAGIKDEFDKREKQIQLQSEREIENVKKNINLEKDVRDNLVKAIEEKRDADLQKTKEERQQKEIDQQKDFQNKVNELKSSIELAAIKDDGERALATIRDNFKKQSDAIDADIKLDADEKRALKLLLQEKEAQELAAKQDEINLAAADKELARLQKQASDITLGFEFRKQVLLDEAALLKKFYDDDIINLEEYTKKKEENAERQKQIDNLKLQAQLENAGKIAGLLGDLSNLLGKQTAAGKAAAIAETTINTYLAAFKAYTAMSSIPPAPLFGVLAAGVATAAGLKNIREIAKVKVPNGGGASSGTVPSISGPTGTAPLAPALPLTQTVTQLQSNTINQLQSATTRAYVVESDVTGSQERIRRLNRAARLG
jgi:hypothetical protein